MKIENEKMKNAMRVAWLLISMMMAVAFAGCSDGSSGGGSSVATVTRYGYKLNATASYHRVSKYVAVDNGDNTFDVKEYSMYFFAISNSNYAKRTGAELCDMVRLNTYEPSSSKEYTLDENKDTTITNQNSPTSKDTFHHYKGETYTVYYYF